MTQELCCDRVARRVHTSAQDRRETSARRARERLLIIFCHDRDFSFATDFSKLFVVTENSLSRQGMFDLVSRQSFIVAIRLGQGRLRRATEHATVYCVVHCLGHCS